MYCDVFRPGHCMPNVAVHCPKMLAEGGVVWLRGHDAGVPTVAAPTKVLTVGQHEMRSVLQEPLQYTQ